MSKTDGTYMNFPPGLREALDLFIMSVDIKRTQWVTELVEDTIVDNLSAMSYDVGQTLDNMHPKRNMMRNYKSLVDRVYQRRSGVKLPSVVASVVTEGEEESDDNIELDTSVIDSITKLS